MTSLSSLLLSLIVAAQAAGSTDLVSYQVKPSDTDARITRFDSPHSVVFDRSTPSSADLFVHMAGTGGVAANRQEYLAIAAAQGYRAISLSYNNTPAVVARCPRRPDPACSGDFRRERLFGENVSEAIDDRPEESIINRLVKLLQHLDREHPGERVGVVPGRRRSRLGTHRVRRAFAGSWHGGLSGPSEEGRARRAAVGSDGFPHGSQSCALD
jgi:hypothetical protein